MSLWININRVTSMLLADGWHRVAEESFYLDSYEFLDGDEHGAFCLHGGGSSGVCATGFSFLEDQGDKVRISGPLTALLAVQERPRP